MPIDTTSALANAAAEKSDEAAIGELAKAYAAQRSAFAADRAPSLKARRERLETLIGMMAANRARIAEACKADFGSHPQGASDIIEVLGVIGRATYAIENLEAWMASSERAMNPDVFGTAHAEVRWQPKGVVGNIVPWNFPFDLSVGPMVDMLAAGNRVMVKPSEYTPACAVLLREMVTASFDPTLVYVAVGEVELARAFSHTPFDHLLYTGSPEVGRHVMSAAALNLTPVTMELGGKCPAILTAGSVTPRNVESIIGTKMVKNGQMCVSVDYCLVPREDMDRFAELDEAYVRGSVPGYSGTDDCTGIISTRHLDRLEGMLAEAADRQARIVPLDDGDVDRKTRRMPISLVLDLACDRKSPPA